MSGGSISARRRSPMSAWLAALPDASPLVRLELASTFRTRRFRALLATSVAGVAGVTLLAATASADSDQPPAEVGQALFQVFFGLALAVVALVAPAQGATAVSAEHEAGTFESLLLTGMSPAAIVRGKVLAILASTGLVLAAMLPVVALVFLFGGVSPVHVAGAYVALGLFALPAVAYGVALSALTRRTRAALLAVLATFPFGALVGLSIVTALGEAVARDWGLALRGPFWFVDALAVRPFAPETLGFVVALPFVASGMATWLFGIGAATAMAPPSGDRSSAFKRWCLVASPLAAVGAAALVAVARRASEAADAHVWLTAAAASLPALAALVLLGETPLPRDRLRRGALRRWLGPGAASTARWFALFAGMHVLLVALVPALVRLLRFPTDPELVAGTAGSVAVGLAGAAVSAAALGVGAALRAAGVRSAVARAIVLVLVVGATLVLTIGLAVADVDAFDDLDDRLPLALALSPLLPLVLPVPLVGRADLAAVAPGLVAGLVFHLVLAAVAAVAAGRAHARVRAVARRAAAGARPISGPPAGAPPADGSTR